MRAEDQRGGRATSRQARHELTGDGGGVGVISEFRFLRQRVPVQPLQQRHAQPANNPYLRVMNVRVHEARQQQPAAQVLHALTGVRGPNLGKRPALDNSPLADE